MSDSEVKPENKTSNESNEEVDIYSDVLSDQDSLIAKLNEKVDKLGREKELLLKSLSSLQKNYEELRKEYGELKEKFKVVSFNSSALFKTAQAEIKRKDRLINELRKEKDDLIFRKATINQASQILRKCAVMSPRKYRSPIKKQNMDRSNPSLETPRSTKVPLIESENPRPAEGPSEELESSRPTKRPSVENNSDTNVSCIQFSKGSLETIELLTNKNQSAPKPSVSNKAKFTPPPLKGPSTAYSRRLYKRIHGVSPPKSNTSVKNDDLPENTVLKLKFTSEETEATTSDCKVESITSKLQKDVQEIIKLGTPSKTSPPTKLSPEKQKQFTTPVKEETPKQNPSKPIAEKLIIQCDLRNTGTLKDRQQNSKNSVSINETIDNILKKQRAGLYSSNSNVVSNIKEEEPKRESLGSDPISKTASRTLTNLNKRTAEKLTISPATFGKLVPHPARSTPDVTPPSKEIFDKSPIETKSESRKRKLSEMLPSENKTSPQQVQRPRRDTYPKMIRKTKFISSLFGESPLKSDVKNDKEIEPSPSKNPINLKTPSPIEILPHPSSPVFPDSPSLDSDDHEDLIIDTTACSQNTPSRMSESDNKNVDETDENAIVKLNFDLNNKSESQVLSQDAETKQSATGVENLTNSDISDERNVYTLSKDTEDKNNSLIINKIIDNQEEKESTIYSPQITVTCGKPVPEEDISECPRSSNEQNKPCAPNNSNQPKAGEDNLRNLHLETSHSSASLDKASSPEKPCESKSLPLSDKKDTILNNITKEETSVARFIPSPPQLTLVSAFKHSENSVFALAEDTLGFVSALTRMRDISPIRTPDKKSKLFNKPLSQTQQSESESLSRRESEVLKNNSFEFLKPLKQGLQNNSSSLSVGLNKIDDTSSKCCHLNNPPSAEPSPSCNLKPLGKSEKEDNDSLKDSICKTSTSDSVLYVKDKFQKSIIQDQQRDIEKVSETSKTIKSYHDNSIVSNSKKSQSPIHNPFKRTKAVRRVTTENKVKSELSTSNVHPTAMKTKHKDSYKAQEIPGRDNLKQMDISDNTNKYVKEMVTPSIELDKVANKLGDEKLNSVKVLEELTNLTGGENVSGSTVIGGEITSKGVNEFSTKNPALPSLVSTNSATIKTFKRSESLKMVQKPLPRNYLNVIKNMEAKKSEGVLESSKIKTQSFEEFSFKEGKLCTKSDNIKEIDKKSELIQISHIASINKKLRVSKHQIKPEKENLNQLKLSETVVNRPSDKNSNDLSDDKNIAQTSLIKDNNVVLSGKVRENKIKPRSTTLNVSHQGKRRNNRRSVSLGPEIRLGIQINLPPIHKHKQRITTSKICSKDSNNIEPVEKMSENILMKSSFKELSEKPFRKSDENSRIESISKASVFQKGSRISTSDNLNSEIKIHSHSKRSSSPSPRRLNISQKCHTKSKSPDVEKTNPRGLRRSLSRSPDCKRSRSNHKVSLRKSPDYERKNRHNLSGPRRTVSGGRSRRSRYDDYRRRSPSPDHRRHNYHEKEHRSRSSHYKYRSDKSRSRSPEPKHRKIEERPRHKSRRSRSSSSLSHDRSSRNCSPSIQKSDSHMSKNVNHFSRKYSSNDTKENISLTKDTDGKSDKHSEENTDDNPIITYREELERMRKEIEMLKCKVNKSEEITPKDSSAQSINNNEEHGLQHSNEDVRCIELSVNKTVELVKRNMSIKNDKIDSNIRMIIEEPELSKTNSAKSLCKPCSTPGKETSTENTQSTKKPCTDTVATLLSQDKPKPIPVKRRVRRLGDSEVQVVSIK